MADTVPVFEVSQVQAHAMENATWLDYDDEHLVLPFEHFIIRYPSPEKLVMAYPFFRDETSETKAMSATLGVSQYEVWETPDGFTAKSTIVQRAGAPKHLIRDGLQLGDHCAFRRADKRATLISVLLEHWEDRGPHWEPVNELPPSTDTILGPRAVLSFLLALNNRHTRAIYGKAPTRQQVRHAQAANTAVEQPITVYIPRERVERTISEVAAGHNVRHVRAHLVRGHLRHLQSGVVVPVRPHSRGGNEARIPIYDAQSVPIEVNT